MILRGDMIRGFWHQRLLMVLLVAALTVAALGLSSQRLLAASQPDFPPLTGRVMDQAGILSAATAATLSPIKRTLSQHSTGISRILLP